MSRRPITNPAEYLQIAGRRWIWIVVPAILVAVLVAMGARKLPKVYRSEALILVEPQKVPADFVKPTVSGNVTQRLESIEQQILSRTQLSQLVDKYSLYADSGLTPDGKVAEMLANIQVTPIIDPDQRPAQVTAFRISFSGHNPIVLQQVTRELAALFISENLKARAQQAQGTEAFIDSRLADSTQNLQDLQNQLRQLKSDYMGSLPEQEGANLQVLGQLQSVLQANAEAIARAQQQKTYLTSLSETVASMAQPQVAPAVQTSPLEASLRQAESDLAVAQQMYTAEHPDVIRLEARVKALKTQVAAQKKAQAQAQREAKLAVAGHPAASDRLEPQQAGQIALLNKEIEQRTRAQQVTQQKIAALQARIEKLPEVEEKLSNLQNAYNVAKTNDNALLEKKAAAATAAAMEQQAEGEEFRIVDPANLPQKPVSPDLVRINIMGALGGLLVGLGLAAMAEMRDPVARGEADLLFYAQVPVLADLPEVRRAVGAAQLLRLPRRSQ